VISTLCVRVRTGLRGWRLKGASYEFRRHATHRLAELGTIGVPKSCLIRRGSWGHSGINKPQSAHRTRWTGGAGTNSMSFKSEALI
jgi:hypothetical protein